MIDLITIVFKDEIEYLKTQAETISTYVPNVENIYVIVNDDDTICKLIDSRWWKQHQHKVHVIPYSKWNYTSRILGWENQQLLKLLAASEAQSKWSMALDAKTWFIQELDYTKLFDNQGRPTTGDQPTVSVFQSSKEFVEQYYKVKMDRVIGPGGVPFVFHTPTVSNMVSEFDDFIDFFQTNVKYPHLVTEFYLYSAFVMSTYGTYETLYSKNLYYTCCNIADFEVQQFDDIFSRMHGDKVLTASIHRRAYPLLTTIQLNKWIDFLSKKQITPQFLFDLTK